MGIVRVGYTSRMEDCPKCGRQIRVSHGPNEYPSYDREDVVCPYSDCLSVIRTVRTRIGFETSTPDSPDPVDVDRERNASQRQPPLPPTKLPLLDERTSPWPMARPGTEGLGFVDRPCERTFESEP